MNRRFSIANLWSRHAGAILAIFAIGLLLPGNSLLAAQAQQPPQPRQPDDVPAIDGGIGPCSVDFTVLDGDKPVYAANVKVHITYGFGGFRKLDLEAGTNAEGKVRFKGLPAKVHNPPLEFHASKDQLTGLATYDPVSECQAKHDIVLEKAKPAATPSP